MKTSCHGISELYALGLLDGPEAKEFEAHAERCGKCRAEVEASRRLMAGLTSPVPPRDVLRDRLLDFTYAPRTPLDLGAYAWDEIAPGVRVHVLRDDTPRGVRAQIMWSEPGAVRPRHRHVGDEDFLVLEGALAVGDAIYSSGDICRVQAGVAHVEESTDGDRCLCYVVHRVPERAGAFEGAPDPRCVSCAFYPLHAAPFAMLASLR
jgi:anti-sigma factor ChrR (cupin superfamily)